MGSAILKGDSSSVLKNLSLATSSDMEFENQDAILKRAYRKIDTRLLAWYAFVYMTVAMESHNVTNAVGAS